MPTAAAPPVASEQRPRGFPLGALVRACRPRQWIKNLLVLAAPGAAGVLTDAEVPERLALTFVSFCALSSATYLLNDLHDREEDRAHERRRTRPIASGQASSHFTLFAKRARRACCLSPRSAESSTMV